MTARKDLFGAHLSVAGGLHTVFERARIVGAHAVQIFTKNKQSYSAKPLEPEAIEAFKAAWQQSDVEVMVAHAGYLINLAASDVGIAEKSVRSLRDELERCEQLSISYLVLHPGAHVGAGAEVGMKRIAQNLSTAFEEFDGKTMLLLETMAGQGTTVGSTFEELRGILSQCEPALRRRLGVCLDTCHIFAAGYDLESVDGYKATMAHFDSVVGKDLLKVVHLNDSLFGAGARRDRHANLGAGEISTEVLRVLAADMAERGVTVILETPSDDGIHPYASELKLLRGKCPSGA